MKQVKPCFTPGLFAGGRRPSNLCGEDAKELPPSFPTDEWHFNTRCGASCSCFYVSSFRSVNPKAPIHYGTRTSSRSGSASLPRTPTSTQSGSASASHPHSKGPRKESSDSNASESSKG